MAHVPPLDEFSFPSGHTLHAVAFTAVACAWYPPLALLLVPFALLVAASRVVLGLHYPSDVLAAIAIGGALATGSILLADAVGATLKRDYCARRRSQNTSGFSDSSRSPSSRQETWATISGWRR